MSDTYVANKIAIVPCTCCCLPIGNSVEKVIVGVTCSRCLDWCIDHHNRVKEQAAVLFLQIHMDPNNSPGLEDEDNHLVYVIRQNSQKDGNRHEVAACDRQLDGLLVAGYRE